MNPSSEESPTKQYDSPDGVREEGEEKREIEASQDLAQEELLKQEANEEQEEAATERRQKRIIHLNELRRKAEMRQEARQERQLLPQHEEAPQISPPPGVASQESFVSRDHDEEGDESLITSEEGITSSAPSVAPGAHAVNSEGQVPRAGVGSDDDATLNAELETVQYEDLPMPPPLEENGAAIHVEAQLAEATHHELAHLRAENKRLREPDPVVAQAEIESDGIDEGTTRKRCRQRRFLFLGIAILVVAAIVGVALGVSFGNGKAPVLLQKHGPWQPVGQVLHGKAADDYFGTSISLSRDGNVMAIGAEQSDNPGYVSVHKFSQATQDWTHMGQELLGQADNIDFGKSVSLNGDGTILAIGANAEVDVAVFQYNSTADHWDQIGSDIRMLSASYSYYYFVSLSDVGDILAVGAPGIHDVYEDDDFVYANFKGYVDDDPENEYEETVFGSVRIFQHNRETESWNQIGQTLTGRDDDVRFGASVSLSSSGKIVGVGSFLDDKGGSARQVSVFEYNSASSRWDPMGDPTDGKVVSGELGYSVSLDDAGLMMAVSAPGDSGGALVYIYEPETSTWSQLGQTLQTQHPELGFSVSLSGNGNILAVGGYLDDPKGLDRAGQVTIFQYNAKEKEWKLVGDPLIGEAEGDEFGWSMSLSADGSVVGVGAKRTSAKGFNSGSAYVFSVSN